MANERIVGGISFGGIHTLMAVAKRPYYFDRYFSVVGVTDITTLPLFKGKDAKYFNAFNVVNDLTGKTGLMVWGDRDEVINFRLSRRLSSQLFPHVQSVEIPGSVHAVLQPQVDAVLNWIN